LFSVTGLSILNLRVDADNKFLRNTGIYLPNYTAPETQKTVAFIVIAKIT
jgi:hypothetical protein